MNENLENQLALALAKALELAEQTGEFALENAPEILRQFFLWHTIDNIIGIFVSLIISFASYKMIVFFGRKEEWDYDELSVVLSSTSGAMGLLFGFILFFYDLAMLIKITVTPELYLIGSNNSTLSSIYWSK